MYKEYSKENLGNEKFFKFFMNNTQNMVLLQVYNPNMLDLLQKHNPNRKSDQYSKKRSSY